MKKLLLLGLFASSVQAAVYHWVDQEGLAHFSDQPHSGAKTIEIKQSAVAPRTEIPAPVAKKSKTVTSYKLLEVTQPSPESTIRSAQGVVAVAVNVEPDLQPSDKLLIVLDGAVVGQPQQTTQFSLSGLERGAHTVAVRLVNNQGKQIKESAAVTFYLHQPRTNMAPTKG